MQRSTAMNLQIGGIAPNVIRELSGIYPTFVSAFKELVSNAYDADATLVKLRFFPDLSKITVQDNGIGMTPFEFQNDYIRIGGSAQHRDEDLTARGRRPIGRKGIGFLAVARYCHLVEVHSHVDRVATFSEGLMLEPRSSQPEPQRIPFFKGPFAQALAPFATIQVVRCGTVKLIPAEYNQDDLMIELSAEVGHKLEEQTLIIEYTMDFRALDLQAEIDYDYLLNLEDNHNLETLQDFCRVRLVPSADWTERSPLASSGQSFTWVTLHLRKFVQRELRTPQRRGRVRNVASTSGLDRFLWHLSRSVPVSYKLSPKELERHGLEILDVPISPIPFSIQVTGAADGTRELKRPLLSNMDASKPDNSVLVRQLIKIESAGLSAQGVLLGFVQPVFPAEMRGISIRVRGVEIGRPSFLGMEVNVLVKYRTFLSQVMGEIVVTEGLDAITAIMPGREGFYAENAQFKALRRNLVGDGAADLGALGQVLERLWERRSIESSAARIMQEARRRREALLDVSHAVTGLSVGSHYGRVLRRLFSRSDIVANGLCHTSEYAVQLPNNIGDYALELGGLADMDYQIDMSYQVVRFNHEAETWNQPLYMLGRDFEISLRNGGPSDPVCEIDFSTDTIYLNWLHPTRGKMGDAMFVKSALFWRIAYLAADGDVDLMMNLAHRLLSFSF